MLLLKELKSQSIALAGRPAVRRAAPAPQEGNKSRVQNTCRGLRSSKCWLLIHFLLNRGQSALFNLCQDTLSTNWRTLWASVFLFYFAAQNEKSAQFLLFCWGFACLCVSSLCCGIIWLVLCDAESLWEIQSLFLGLFIFRSPCLDKQPVLGVVNPNPKGYLQTSSWTKLQHVIIWWQKLASSGF